MADSVTSPVLDKQAIPAEAAARLRKVMLLFVLVLVLSVILTASYVAGRTLDRAAVVGNAGAATAATHSVPTHKQLENKILDANPAPDATLLPPTLPNEPNLEKQAQAQLAGGAPAPALDAAAKPSATSVALAAPPAPRLVPPPVQPASQAPAPGEAAAPVVAKSDMGSIPVVEARKEVEGRLKSGNEQGGDPLSAPKPGLYLQIGASDKQGAAAIAKAAGKAGIEAVIAAGPNENIFRVIAGPFTSSPDLAKARASLEASGYRPFPRRF